MPRQNSISVSPAVVLKPQLRYRLSWMSNGVSDSKQIPSTSRFRRSRLVFVTAALWLGAVGAGFSMLLAYDLTPGAAATAPLNWPAEARVRRSPGQATLVFIAHPRCPCTRASIGELAELMAQAQGRVSAHVLFVKPAGAGPDWQTDLLRLAADIPGVSVIEDEGGREAQRFGSLTSGQTLVYDADGRRVFSGGITAARGHAGDNLGRSSIMSFLRTGSAEENDAPVFGCSLFDAPRSDDIAAQFLQ